MAATAQQELADAYKRKSITYPDFKPTMDFVMWVNGYKEKIRIAFGLTTTQNDEVQAEVVRSISGRLQTGQALDAYHRLTQTEKDNYDQLIKKLTEEFIDPQEKQKFLEDFEYTKRRKGQSIKDFIQDIKKDMGKYSDMPDYHMNGQTRVENAAKVREGIRRFRKGIRNRKGKKDKEQMRQIKFKLLKEADLTWENALDVACRYEAAHDMSTDSSASSSSSSDDGDDNDGDDAASFLEVRKKSKSKRKKKKGKAEAVIVAALSVKVKKNSDDIKDLKGKQEQLSTNLAEWRRETKLVMDENKSVMDEILQEVRASKVSATIDPGDQFSNEGGASGGDGDIVAAMSRVGFR